MQILTFSCLLLLAVGCRGELFEGDIVLDKKAQKIVDGQNTFDAVVSDVRKWTNGVVPYIFASDFDADRQGIVRQAIAEYNKYTCIRFVPRTNQRNYVKFIIGGGCYSYIGMVGGMQEISIGKGCEVKGIVMHEMMHCSGFWHEQSRLDRDSHIQINWQNVKNGRSNHNFRKYSHGEADYYGAGYDFESIMHYGNWDFSINNQRTIVVRRDPIMVTGQRDGFSQTDVNQLNKVYKCTGYENVKVPPLKGCVDSFNYCNYYAKSGECQKYPRYYYEHCCKSCTDLERGKKLPCFDEKTACSRYAAAGHCTRSAGYMRRYCPKTCNFC